MLKHIGTLENPQASLLGENACYQILQQIADFLCYPVLVIVKLGDATPVKVEILAGMKERNAQDCGSVTSADATAPVRDPFIPRKTFCSHQHNG